MANPVLYKHFQTPSLLTAFLNDAANAAITIINIAPDQTNGGWVLFYTA